MWRVTKVAMTVGSPTWKVEGRIVGEAACLLRHECVRLGEEGGPLTLDLREVSYIDRTGAEVLRRLRAEGVAARLVCTPLIQELLDDLGTA